MPLEIKQLNVRSTVLGARDERDLDDDAAQPDIERLKQEILACCRELIAQCLRETQER